MKPKTKTLTQKQHQTLPISKYKQKKMWMLIKDRLEDHTIEAVPFTFAKNISIITDDQTIDVKNRKDFNDTISTLMTKLGSDSDNIRVKYQINYDKLVTRVEQKIDKLFSVSVNK